MNRPALAPYESPLLRQVTGPALRPGGLALTQRAVERCGLTPGERVLDLGCGLGASLDYLRQEHGLRAVGLDLSPSMLAQARDEHPGLPLLRANAAALPVATAALHAVLLECVLSLAPAPATVLAECVRVLRPGGWLVQSDLYLRAPLPGEDDPSLPGCLGGARSREAWQALARQAGLELVVWEDHSELLRRLAAQLAWSQGSATAWWGGCVAGDDGHSLRDWAARTRPGYFLLLARKKAEPRG